MLELFIKWQEHVHRYPGLEELITMNGNENVVLVNYWGKVMNYNTLYKSLMKFLRKNDLQHCGVLFHKLRHFYATHMLETGVDINVINKLLEHANVSTTCNTYIKVNIMPKVQAVENHSKYIERLHTTI